MINRFGIRETKMKKNSGFTLIELMIVVAVIGILVAIALPSYNDSVMKARRGEAESALIEAANAMERYYTQNGSYTGAVAGTTFSATVPTNGAGTIFYNITLPDPVPANTFTLTATPTAAQNDPLCGNLSITQTNLKGETGTGTVADCW